MACKFVYVCSLMYVLMLTMHMSVHLVIGQQQRRPQRARADQQGDTPLVSGSLSGAPIGASSQALAGATLSTDAGANVGPVSGSLSANLNGPQQVARPNVVRPNARPSNVINASDENENDNDDDEQVRPARTTKRPNNNKKRPTPQEVRLSQPDRERYATIDESQEDEGECYDEIGGDDDYGHLFRGQMNHFNRLMGNVFEQMQGLASGDYSSFPSGSNVAVASAMSNGDDYSRVSSLVNNNGRRRGVVSETRNGRTQTRRIGDDDENEDE